MGKWVDARMGMGKSKIKVQKAKVPSKYQNGSAGVPWRWEWPNEGGKGKVTFFCGFLLSRWGFGGNLRADYTPLNERRVTIYLDRVEPAYGGSFGRMGRGFRVEGG